MYFKCQWECVCFNWWHCPEYSFLEIIGTSSIPEMWSQRNSSKTDVCPLILEKFTLDFMVTPSKKVATNWVCVNTVWVVLVQGPILPFVLICPSQSNSTLCSLLLRLVSHSALKGVHSTQQKIRGLNKKKFTFLPPSYCGKKAIWVNTSIAHDRRGTCRKEKI